MVGRAFLAVAGALVGVFTFHVVQSNSGFSFASEDPQSRALIMVAGLAPIATGVWTTSGRPSGRRVPALLVLVGVGWFVSTWADPAVGSDVAFTIGLLASAACPPLVAHLLFAYPSGPGSAADRVVVAAGYATALGVFGIVTTVLYDPAAGGCGDCPSNLVLLSNRPGAYVQASSDGIRLVFGWAIAAVALALWKLLRSTSAHRHIAAPVVVPALVFVVATALTYFASLGGPYLSQSVLAQRLWEVQAIALVALAAGAAWAPISARKRHRELTRLVVDLHRSADSGGMRSVLARLLNDADLEIGYPVTGGRYIDAHGHVLKTVAAEGLASTSLTHAGREVAVVVHRRGLLEDPRLVEEIATAAHLGLDNERLRAETWRQLAEVRASRTRIVAAGDEERRRLERDLHDGAQQRVVGLALALRLLRNTTDGAGSSVFAEAEARVHLALAELRELARGLYPVILAEEGLAAAIEALSESTQLRVRDAPVGRFPAEIETTAYQVVAMAAGSAPTTASITESEGWLVLGLQVSDPTAALDDVADRVDTIGGLVTVKPGSDGSHVLVRLPLEPPSSHE